MILVNEAMILVSCILNAYNLIHTSLSECDGADLLFMQVWLANPGGGTPTFDLRKITANATAAAGAGSTAVVLIGTLLGMTWY